MRKTLLTPEQIESGAFTPETKEYYYHLWRKHLGLTKPLGSKKELKEKLIQNAHLPIDELAKLLGLSTKEVSQLAYRVNVKLNARPGRKRKAGRRKARVAKRPEEINFTPETLELKKEVEELIAKGFNREEIAQAIGLGYLQVKNRLRYWGLEAKPKARGKKKKQAKIKPVEELKFPNGQVVEKENKVAHIAGELVKTIRKPLESKQRDYSIKKQHQLGYMRLSFYMPFDATEEEIEAERQRRLLKYKKSA